MFDEQPDGDPHGECAAEIHKLTRALNNCRMYAGLHRKEAWAADILRLCYEAGVTGSPRRASSPLPQAEDVMRQDKLDAERYRFLRDTDPTFLAFCLRTGNGAAYADASIDAAIAAAEIGKAMP